MFHRSCGMVVLTLRLHRITRSGEARELAETLQDRPESWVQNPWGYVDARENAQACKLCSQAQNLGFEVFNATAADMLSVVSMEELIRRYCPGVEIRHRIEGTERLVYRKGRATSRIPSLPLLARLDRRDPEGACVNPTAVLTAVSSGLHRDIRGRVDYARSGRP
jgi:hypothetical protein